MEKIKRNFGFGYMRLPMQGEEVDLEQTRKMVDTFLDAGFNYFDTAHGYLQGKSEECIKSCLSSRYPREAYVLTDKLTMAYFKKQEDIRPFFESQLEICGVDYFDFYLMHSQNAEIFKYFKERRAYETVLELKKEGKIRHFGISFHDRAEVLEQILTEYPQIEVVQIQLNYADFDDPAVQSRKCYEVCRKHGKPVIIMEPVRGGRLANLPERGAEVLAAADPDASQASWAYRFCLDLPGVLTVLAGASTLEQMRDNMATFQSHAPLTEAERGAIDGAIAALRSVDLIPCTNCGYCVKDCPEGVKIPIAMNLLNLEKTCEDNEFVKGLYSWQAAEGPASKCIQCGTCEAMCPQSIGIIDHLAEAVEHFEG